MADITLQISSDPLIEIDLIGPGAAIAIGAAQADADRSAASADGAALFAQAAAAYAGEAPANLVEVNGWRAQADDASAFTGLRSFLVERKQYTPDGLQTLTQRLYLTTRVRDPFPDQATFDPNDIALSDKLYAGDSAPGAENQSAEIVPKPIAAWMMRDRALVGDSLPWELVAFHKDARLGAQVPFVRVRANDGTTATDWQSVFSTQISTLYGDENPLEVYAGTLDISGLADGLVWLEAEEFSWFGSAASVLKSEEVNTKRGFSRRNFLKDPALLAARPQAYVQSTGNDGTGVVSTTPATAAASPYLTVAGALKGLNDALGTTLGALDGAQIRIVDTVNSGTVPFTGGNYAQDIAAVEIVAAPGVDAATAVVQMNGPFRARFGTHTTGITEGALHVTGCTVVGTAATGAFQGETGDFLHVQFADCILNGGSANNFRISAHLSAHGGSWSNQNPSNSATGEIRRLRGVDLSTGVTGSPEGWVCVGCSFNNAGTFTFKTPTEDGHIIANNRFMGVTGTSVVHFKGSSSGVDLGSIAVVQNVIEMVSGTGVGIRLSADSDNGNLTHVVCIHNTVAGLDGTGRYNIAYDDTPGVRRFHKNVCFKGNIGPERNTKGDIFMSDATRTGNFEFHHGVGCAGNFTRRDNSASGALSFGQLYNGPGSVIGGGDPAFTDDQSIATTGSGGGTYDLTEGSPARGILAERLLGFDQSGAAREPGPQPAGAYV